MLRTNYHLSPITQSFFELEGYIYLHKTFYIAFKSLNSHNLEFYKLSFLLNPEKGTDSFGIQKRREYLLKLIDYYTFL
jgi:hypothetical protein